MKRKLTTRTGHAIYARRKTIVEPVFGQIKQALGFRQFLLRQSKKSAPSGPLSAPPIMC